MNKLGMGHPNNSSAYLNELYMFPWAGFVVLQFQMGELPRLRAAYPNATILMRGYLENWYKTDPTEWALQIVRWATEARPFTTHWTWANEQNLKTEGHPFASLVNPRMTPHLAQAHRLGLNVYPPRQVYEDIAAWNQTVVHILRERAPWIILHYPANSQGHSDDQDDGTGYIGFEIQRSVVEQCDFLDVHAYWTKELWQDLYYGLRYKLLHNLFPNMPLFISECGTIDMLPGEMESWLRALPDYVLMACPFIWDSDEANAVWRLYNKPPMLDTFRRYLASPNPPQPSPPSVEGWCPFAIERPVTISNFAVGRMGQVVSAVVLHVVEGAMANVFPFFNNPALKVSAHFCIGKNGTIEQYVSIHDTAYGNGLAWKDNTWQNVNGKVVQPSWQDIKPTLNPNFYTLSIEHEGYAADKWTPAMVNANNRLLLWIAEQCSLVYVPHRTLIGHYEINPVDKANCPGPNVEYSRIANDIAAITAARKLTWMPINDRAALYKFAQANNLGCPQTDEFTFAVGKDAFVGQVYNLGVVYAEKGNWSNIRKVGKL